VARAPKDGSKPFYSQLFYSQLFYSQLAKGRVEALAENVDEELLLGADSATRGGAGAAADDLEQEGLCDALADARLLAPLRREEAHLRREKHRAPSNKTTQAHPDPRERA